jgi:catechol 2,3-dioxygenase-like lactoylglutathione lyase family enzyme
VNVRGIAWLGIRTARFDEMASLIGSLTGEPPSVDKPGFGYWQLADGDVIEVFGLERKAELGTAPVAGFEVDDIGAARGAILEAGGEIVGGYGPTDDGYEAIHFRAPDGNVYEVLQDPGRAARRATTQR